MSCHWLIRSRQISYHFWLSFWLVLIVFVITKITSGDRRRIPYWTRSISDVSAHFRRENRVAEEGAWTVRVHRVDDIFISDEFLIPEFPECLNKIWSHWPYIVLSLVKSISIALPSNVVCDCDTNITVMSYAMDKLKRTRRKRRHNRKKFLFSSGIRRINRIINPALSLQRRSVLIIDQMLQDIIERICEEAKVARQISGRRTLRAQDLHRGFKFLFKGKRVLKHVCLGCQEVINSPGLSHGKSSAEWEWLEEMYESHPNMSRRRGEEKDV